MWSGHKTTSCHGTCRYIIFPSLQYTENKSFCEDLTEGKFSFPIIHGIHSDPQSSKLMSILSHLNAVTAYLGTVSVNWRTNITTAYWWNTYCAPFSQGARYIVYYQELMSGEAAKERATTAYARVPSKSKLLASELPNMETCSSI